MAIDEKPNNFPDVPDWGGPRCPRCNFPVVFAINQQGDGLCHRCGHAAHIELVEAIKLREPAIVVGNQITPKLVLVPAEWLDLVDRLAHGLPDQRLEGTNENTSSNASTETTIKTADDRLP